MLDLMLYGHSFQLGRMLRGNFFQLSRMFRGYFYRLNRMLCGHSFLHRPFGTPKNLFFTSLVFVFSLSKSNE